MKPTPTVVELKLSEQNGTDPSRLPPILQSVRQHAKRELTELLQGLFNNIDDALFEMADRSQSNEDQHRYFEAMREIRLKRKRLIERWLKEFAHGFNVLFSATEDEALASVELDSGELGDNLSLVGQDDMEVSVANAGIVSKVRTRYAMALLHLTTRIDHLCELQVVTERSNPLGPQRLSAIFAQALEELDVEIKVKLILIKLYERFVMERLDDVLKTANRLLAEAGVLPNIRNVLNKGRNPGTRSAPAAPQAQAEPEGGGFDSPAGPGAAPWANLGAAFGLDALAGSPMGAMGHAATGGVGMPAGGGDAPYAADDAFGVIQHLLAQQRSRYSVRHRQAPAPSTSQSVLSTAEVMALLNSAQSETIAAPLDVEHVPVPMDLRHVVLGRAEQDARMGQADDDVVNFVSMLFDYILNDRNLAIPMKALIARLQIPIVRLAVVDKSFFAKAQHPARRLLNALSSAGIGWSSARELKRDELYDKIEAVVLGVINGDSEQAATYQHLLDELEAFVNRDRQRHSLVEQRVKESEKGKARNEAAKRDVQQLINQKAAGIRVPSEVGRFISESWSKVLVYTALNASTDSEEWRASVKTLDDLLWSVQPLDRLEDIEERERQQPDLLEQLRTGVNRITASSQETDQLMALLKAELDQVADHDRAFLEEDELPEVPESFEELEKVVLTSVDEVDLPDEPPEPVFVHEINKLTEGVWAEIRDEDGEPLRGKLATIVQPGERYVFVNRRGMKVAEKNRMQLAVLLKEERLKILDESQVFDRALQAVIGNLRQMHDTPSEVS